MYEKEIILELVDNGHIVIAGGGGGIPTLEKDGKLTEVDAVIDKDFAASKIASLIKADLFMIITAVDGIWMNYGKDNAYHLSEPTVAELQLLVDSGEFPAGSMKLKVEALIYFMNSKHNNEISACITSLEKAADALEGKAGTWVKK